MAPPLRLTNACFHLSRKASRRCCSCLLQKVCDLVYMVLIIYSNPLQMSLLFGLNTNLVEKCLISRVRCAKRGGVRFTIGGNPYFLMVLIHNVGGAGDIRSVRIKGQYSGWVTMFRNWGSLWTCRTKLSGPLSFMITTSDGRTLVSNRAVGPWWKFGQTWEGSQFR